MIRYVIVAALLVAIMPLTDALVDWQFRSNPEGFTQEEAAAHAALVVRACDEAEQHRRAVRRIVFKPRNERERAEKIAEVFNAGRE